MGVNEADQLQQIIEHASPWPIWGANAVGNVQGMAPNVYARAGMYGETLRDVATWVALREADRAKIKALINWPPDRAYRFDPLPQRICGAYSDLLFGEDPDFFSSDPKDQENLDAIIEANDLPSELRRFCEEVVSEGEGWWRVYVDLDVSEWPIIEFNSRIDVIPLFSGRKILAAAFVTDLFTQEITIENQPVNQIWRHIEIQTDGLSRNLLYKGTINTIGIRVNLAEATETKDLPEEWNHGLDIMLAGRIPNKLGRDWRLGISEFHGVKDLLFDLNEQHTILAENARNTAKARMVVPASALDENGQFDAGKDAIVAESLDEALDGSGKSGPYAVLEYNFQATPLLEYMDSLVTTILTRVGLAEQFVQSSRGGGEGAAYTGTALRTRLIPTTLAASGKGRFWDSGAPNMLAALAQVSNLPTEKGGTGQSWTDVKGRFYMKRSSVLPEDENEETQRHVMAVQGEIESIETAVRSMHPDWDDEDVEEEIERIRTDRSGGAVAPEPGEPGGGPEDQNLNMPGQGEPGSPVPGVDTEGARQPGATGGSQGPDGQTPGKTRPRVAAGGPR